MERLQLLPGEVLIRAGGTEGDIFFIESGRVNVQLSNPAGPPTRLRSLRAGAIFGEAARYLGRKRTADVVVHAPSIIWRLSDAALDRMEAEDRDLAAMLHAVMARSLAEKVEKTNGMLTAALA
jgi:SulP family sulfate permease